MNPIDKINVLALVALIGEAIEEEALPPAVERAEVLLKTLKKLRQVVRGTDS